jgi:hypothetical protein
MSKPWFAFFKRAAACVGVSALLALASMTAAQATAVKTLNAHRRPAAKAEDAPVSTAPTLAADLPEREVALSTRGGQVLKVGDTVAYSFVGGTDPAPEAHWGIDAKQSGLKLGFLFRPGRLFTPLMAGELSLPPLAIIDEKGVIVGKTKPLVIKIDSNLSEKERASGQPPKPEPAVGPLGLPFPAWIQSAVAFTILGFVLFGIFFLVRYLRRKAALAIKKMLPKKPYDQAALDRMDSLLKQGLIEKGAFKPFYFGLSEALKFYYGERFDFDAQESTTSELLALMREQSGAPGLNENIIRKTQELFEALDPVKFADQIPTGDEAREVHRRARELITSTRKVVVEPIAPGAAKQGGGKR